MKINWELRIVIIILITTSIASCSTAIEKLEQRSIGLINNVSYQDSSFDNPNASNGFLVKFENQTYAITAKHVLMIAKSAKMKFVDFEGNLKQWKMHPKNDTTKYVVVDQLLNTNRNDSLTWEYMGNNWETYDDWLVFSIKKNKTKFKPLKLRNTKIADKEKLFAIGWTYQDTSGAQRMYEYEFVSTEGNFHNLVQTKGPKNLGGLSGAPIVDEKGQVVGLVSSGWVDEETNEMFLQATSVSNILTFLSSL